MVGHLSRTNPIASHTYPMSFVSSTSKARAEASVNKLLAGLIPDAQQRKQTKKPKSSTELLAAQFETPVNVVSKRDRQKKNKLVKKKQEEQKRFEKLVKYKVIKSHKNNATEAEQKYLKKLIKRNVNQLKMLEEYEDFAVEDEIKELERELAAEIEAKQKKRKDKSLSTTHTKSVSSGLTDRYNNLVKEGKISVPGLTPGLAPVDYVSSDEEEEDGDED